MSGRRHCIDLGQFVVGNDGNFGGGSFIEHMWRSCDWRADIDGLTLPQVAREARDHAAFCDGSPRPPQPRTEPSVLGARIQDIWMDEVARQLTQPGLRYGSQLPAG